MLRPNFYIVKWTVLLLAGVILPVAASDSDGLQTSTAGDPAQSTTMESPHIPAPELRSSPIPAVPAADAPDPLPQPSPPSDSSPDLTVAANTNPDMPPGQSATDSTENPPPSRNVTINLINLMVKRGLITKEDSQALIQQAQQEATAAQQSTPPSSSAPTPAQPVSDSDEVQVNYVPDVVKNQIRDDIKADVMKQARDEHWGGADNNLPDWVHRFHVTGDIRVRYEDDTFPDGNATGSITNFNAINTGSPFDINTSTQKSGLLPTYNVDEDRSRFRLRARLGSEIDLGENFTAGLRVGTGSDNSPVSENQTLGGVNSFTQNQGGDFGKYQIWLDRAFLRYQLGGQTDKDFSVSIGRFDNPFFGTSMIWADDIAFDGFVAQGKYQVTNGVTPFLTAGAFPVFNTDLNFGTNSTIAGNGYQSEDKWLYAVQGGTTWNINKDFTAKGAVAFYDFENIQGRVSSPISQDEFAAYGTAFNGDTDDSRPSFAQHGNTYIALRDVVLDPSLTTPTPVYEYFGLASPFRELALTGQLDFSRFDPFHIMIIGEYVNNLAFDRNAIEDSGPAILPGPQNNNNADGTFAGGGVGYNIRITVGAPALQKRWDWNVNVTYRYLESDAVVDAFNDADFGGYLTGTNLKGYIVGANLALAQRVWTSIRWLSADSIAGPPLKTDTLQFDISAKF
jgi:Putative porin